MATVKSSKTPRGTSSKPVVAGKARPAGRAAAAMVDSPSRVPQSEAQKQKLVRDSFTIPKSEYLVLQGLKTRAADLTRPVKKSELLRAGITVLDAMSDRLFLAALKRVPSLKTGRPKGVEAN